MANTTNSNPKNLIPLASLGISKGQEALKYTMYSYVPNSILRNGNLVQVESDNQHVRQDSEVKGMPVNSDPIYSIHQAAPNTMQW